MQALRLHVEDHFNRRFHIAHGFDHAERVAALARHIAERESYDPDVAEVAGLLHDIGRTVQEAEADHGPAGLPLAAKLLVEHTAYRGKYRLEILAAVHDHSRLHTEGHLTHILQDADMLDGLGAVGIMRAYTSKAAQPCYDPDEVVPTIGERDGTIHQQIAFQMEWLDMMHTATGREIAERRHARMQEFLENFRLEVTGEDFA